MIQNIQSTMSYYENKKIRGPIYNWREVFAEYNRLGVPEGLYDPTKTPVEKCRWNAIISIRSRGKTTAWLLIGMIVNRKYGCQVSYIRETEDMLAPVNARELFKTINEYEGGRYIRDMTDEQYNYILVKDRRGYFAHIDEKGDVDRRETEPWFYMLSIDRNFYYKSSLNLPEGNLILFDEFISNKYKENDFIYLCDINKTIIRKRLTPVIIMLANNIDISTPYFRELEISHEVKKLEIGESKICYSSGGTAVYVELDKVPEKEKKNQSIFNRLFFGFKNPKLVAITGEGSSAWAIDIYPHITHEPDEELLDRRLYIDVTEELLNVEFVLKPTLGLVANIHPANEPKRDSVILTTEEITDPRQDYAFGKSAIATALWKLYTVNRCFYSDNETGARFKQYINMAKVAKR